MRSHKNSMLLINEIAYVLGCDLGWTDVTDMRFVYGKGFFFNPISVKNSTGSYSYRQRQRRFD